jgi:hypothetical protein
MIVFTAGAIIIIVTDFELDDPGLHPQTGIGSLGFLIRLYQPYLATENRFNSVPKVSAAGSNFFISRSKSHLTSLCAFLFFNHFLAPLL